MEELPPAPPPWIEQYQRTHLAGDSASTTFQGLLVDLVIVPKSAIDAADPSVAAEANIEFVNSMQDEAFLLPGEFAQEALWSYFAIDYVTQAARGGHVQYFRNRGGDELALKLAGLGLKSMVADPHLALFSQGLKWQRMEPKEARKAATKAGFRSVEAALRDVDRQLSELEQSEPLKARYKMWLKSLRKVRVVSDEEWREALARFGNANPLIATRRAERAQAEAEILATDPTALTVGSLCETAGVRFTGHRVVGMQDVRTAWPEGPKREAYCVTAATNAGERIAIFFADGMLTKKYRAVLIEPGQALPVADVSLTRDEYEALVPV